MSKANKEKKLPEFDPDWPVDHPQNVEAARARGLRFNPCKGCYVDEDGYLILDRFGQPLG